MNNRRQFLQGASAAAILAASWTRGLAETLPAASQKGNAQVNLNNLNPESYGMDFPFIDCGKMMTSWQLFGSGVTTDIFSHLNADGFPTGFPAGGTVWRSQTKGYLTASDPRSGNWILDWDGNAEISANIGGGSGYPGIKATIVRSTSNKISFNVTAINSSDITFQGGCTSSGNNTTITVTGSKPGTVWTNQRISGAGIPADAVLAGQINGASGGDGTYAIYSASNPFNADSTTVTLHAYEPGEAFGVFIQVTAVKTAPTRIRFYRADEAALLNAGQITAPHFIAFYRKYGCLRFMDWQYTNGGLTAQWINRPKKSNYTWVGGVLTAYCGICTQAAGSNDYTAPNTIDGNPTAWTDGMLVQAVLPAIPNMSRITKIAVNATTGIVTITAPGHGFSTGQSVCFPIRDLASSGWGVPLNKVLNSSADGIPMAPDFAVTPIDANSFTLNGVDGRNWQTYVGGGCVSASLRLGTSTLPKKRVLSGDGQNIYWSQYELFITGTATRGMGTPRSFVYNAAMDALLCTVSPGDETGQLLGTPIEVITQLCNECNVSPWICLHVNVTDECARQTAAYLRANLNSGLRARIELGNELWNGSFNAWNITNILGGLQLRIVNSTKDYSLNYSSGAQWMGWRFYNIMEQVNIAYAGAMNQVYRVLAVNTYANNNTYISDVFKAPLAGIGEAKPFQRADAFAIAPYFEVNRNTYPTAQALYQFKTGNSSAAFAAADKWFSSPGGGVLSIADWKNSVCPFWAHVASTFGLEMHQYEGGWGVYPAYDYGGSHSTSGHPAPLRYDPGTGAAILTLSDVMNFWRAYKASENWGAQYANALAVFRSAGGKFASNYWITSGLWNENNMFGSEGPSIFGVPMPYYISRQPTPERVAFDAYNAS